MHQERLTHLLQVMKDDEFEFIALCPGPSLSYLTDLSFHFMERPIVCLIKTDSAPVFILPELEQPKAETSPLDLHLFTYGEDDESRLRAFRDATAHLGVDGKRIGIEPLRFRVFELRLLEWAAPNASFSSAEMTLSKLRIIKQQIEIEAMRHAVQIAEEALRSTLPLIQIGMSEQALASELTLQLLRAGSQSETPFSPIVASGPNSAIPHATPTERTLQAGDLLILDWGATHQRYMSDITRTFAIGELDPGYAEAYEAVLLANQAGRKAIRPGVPCETIDRAAREVIEQAGYGDHFIHRTGHGLGLEAHEPPNIRQGNNQPLEPGMTFTVEPGIYLPDRGGVRIEDNIVVTKDGAESFTSYPRELEVIG